MLVVSRLLGHGSTDITEKVYARFLPETLSVEIARLAWDINSLSIVKEIRCTKYNHFKWDKQKSPVKLMTHKNKPFHIIICLLVRY